MTTRSKQGTRVAVLILAAAVLTATALQGEEVFVTSFKGPAAVEDVTPCPLSCVAGAVSEQGSAATSTAMPMPVIPAPGRRARYGYGTPCSWSVTPTDVDLSPVAGGASYHFSALSQIPGLYRIYVTLPTKGNCSPDLEVHLSAAGGDLSDVYGTKQAAVPLTCFNSNNPVNTWMLVGYLTNRVANPTLTFTYASGTLGQNARWYMDAVRFEAACACCNYIPLLAVDSPLRAGQTYVRVTGVAEGATNVTVYADGTFIGSTNRAGGFAAGQLTVRTIPLIAEDAIRATQSKGGCTSLLRAIGPTVGLRVELVLESGQYAAITIGGRPGRAYEIQGAADLAGAGSWFTLTNLTLPETVGRWVDTSVNALTNAGRFYRVGPAL